MGRTESMRHYRDAHLLGADGIEIVKEAPRLECGFITRTALPTSRIHVTKDFSAKDAPGSAKDVLSPALDALNQLAAKLDSAIKNSPLSEIEKNARQHFISQLARQGLVTREEYEVQVALLERARAKLAELEIKIAHLEQERQD